MPGTGPKSCSRWRRARACSTLLTDTVGGDLSRLRILDVGCGTGGFLRQLIDWGADPARLTGVEIQQDRLDAARRVTAGEVQWRLGTLDTMGLRGFDLVNAAVVAAEITFSGNSGANIDACESNGTQVARTRYVRFVL